MFGVLIYIFTFIFGAIVGSFLNVVILRYNTGEGLKGRSHCFSCRKELSPRDLVPIISFLINGGRCRFCGSRISPQYPLVEFFTALLFTLIVWRFPGEIVLPVFFAYIVSLLIIITVYDLRHKIIPNALVYLFIVSALFHPVLKSLLAGSFALLVVGVLHSILSGGIFFLIFWGLWRFSEGKWIGFGDAKLAAGIGALLGLAQGFTALVVGFWLGAIVGLFLLLLSRIKTPFLRRYFSMKSEIPFAPFLAIGIIITLLLDFNVIPF